jgi:hypothetical protein
MKKLVTFPVVNTQVCGNCKISLSSGELYSNVIDMSEDAYGIPTIMVRCPVCKTPMEWETRCN